MRKFTLFITGILLSTASAWGITVSPTAGGQLSTLVTDHNVTTLVVNGVIDARDFEFMGNQLKKLTNINLQAARIEAYNGEKPIFANQFAYPANTLPTMGLASHPTLQQITLPGSATTIGAGALAGCKQLTTVTCNDGLLEIDAFAFAGCTKLATFTIPKSVQRLGDGAFTRCSALTTVKLGTTGTPSTLTIGNEAFLGCSVLATISFNSKLASIGHRAFAGTKFKALDLSAYNQLANIGDYAFAKAPLTTVKFPNSVKAMGTGALLYSSATSVNFPTSLQRVPAYALAGAKGITSIDLTSVAIDSIGDYAFYKVNNPTSVQLPATTYYIGTKAMAGMTGLTSITSMAMAVPELGDDVWDGLDQPAITLRVPASSVQAYESAAQWKEFNIVVSFRRGDVNMDGIVDISDVNAVINFMLNLPPGEPFVFQAADLNQDNKVDVEDLNHIINIILDLEFSPMVPDTGDMITIDDFAVEPGEIHTIDVKLSNLDDYSALQFDMVLPDGLTLVDDAVTTAQSTDGFQIQTSENGNTLRVLCYSMQGKNLGNSEDNTVLHVKVQATDQLTNQSIIALDNVTLSTHECAPRHCENTYAYVSKNTAVNDIAATNCKVWAQGGTLVIESDNALTAQLVAMNGTFTQLAVLSGHNEYTDIEPGFYVVRIAGESHKVVIKN
ncbi:MAG: leucine-rich repeat protein [Muribaculaceae bacterium]|nr:leucine-rich repeat protein [Muribaculaceae bacterium]